MVVANAQQAERSVWCMCVQDVQLTIDLYCNKQMQ